MSDQINERKEARLRRLYGKPANEAFFNWAAARKRDSSMTSAETVMRRGRMDRWTAVGLLQDLAQAGLGDFYNGRRGAKTRIEWNYSLRDVGAAARGAIEDVTEIDRSAAGELGDDEEDEEDEGVVLFETIEHVFHLRPGVRISVELPSDLTPREADRFAAFVKTLPLDE